MFVCSLCVYMPYCMCGRSEGLWELVLFHCVSTGDETHQDYQKSLFLSSAISPAPKMSLKFLFFSITLNCKLVFLGFQWSDFTDRELAIHWANRSLKCALSITLFPSEVYGPIPTLALSFPNSTTQWSSDTHLCIIVWPSPGPGNFRSDFTSQQDHHCYRSGRCAGHGLRCSHKSAQLLLYAWLTAMWLVSWACDLYCYLGPTA